MNLGQHLPLSSYEDELMDEIETTRPIDPAHQFAAFTVPGLPIVTSERNALRGRARDTAIQQHYVSKGVLPL